MKDKLKKRQPAISYQLSAISNKLSIILLMAVIGINMNAYAADTTKVKAFTLKEAQEFAVNNNYSTQNAKTDILKAKKLVAQTTAIGLPQINASASYQKFIDIPTQLIPGEFFGEPAGSFIPLKFGTQHNGSGTITASQLLFDGSYIVGLQAAKTYQELSKKALVKSEAEVREAVAQSYYLVLVAEETKKLNDSILILTKNTLEQTKESEKNGLSEETDVDQWQLTVSNQENRQNMLLRQIEIVYNQLKYQMGLDIATKITLTDNLKDIVNSVLLQNLVAQEFDYKKHIDYSLLQTMEKADQLILKRDKYAYLPSLNCFLTTSRNAQRNDFNFFTSKEPWFKTTIFGVSLSLPIWNSGIKHYKIQQDKLELKKHQVEMTQAQQGLTLSVENNKAQMKTYSDQYGTEIKNMALAKKIYNKTLQKYNEGVSSSLDLTQIQNQYLTTQGNYFNVILQLLNANSNLNKALGN